MSAHLVLQAMSLEVPVTPGHPNKSPFSGVLTKLDEPSDKPPDGSKGKRVVMTKDAAEQALPSLLGMSVDYTDNLDGHDVKKKIGVITEANVVGNEVHIAGFLYAADFPDEVKRIKAMRGVLGFSWEIANIYTNDVNADPMVIIECVFTGAAVLRKDKAAYQTTSLAASATKETEMTPEQIKELTDSILKANAEAIKGVTDRLEKIEQGVAPLQAAAHHVGMVEPHASALEKVGMAMEKDGIGGHPIRGHVKACYAMASHLRAAASKGELASEWPGYEGSHAGNPTIHAKSAEDKAADEAKDKAIKELNDSVAALKTQISDLKASAAKGNEASKAPERKTLTPQVTALLAKASLTLPTAEGEKLTIGAIDTALKASGLNNQQKLEVKAALSKAGAVAA